MPQPDLLLITGIPGTGKTCYGDKFAAEFGFMHYDLEDDQTRNGFFPNPGKFIADAIAQNKSVVVTWGFFPDPYQTALVQQFRSAGFKLIWFDGDRTSALREFKKRGTVSVEAFDAQIQRIENAKLVERLKPAVINSFDDRGQFKPAADLLAEIRRT